jgi:hypothetical protein
MLTQNVGGFNHHLPIIYSFVSHGHYLPSQRFIVKMDEKNHLDIRASVGKRCLQHTSICEEQQQAC